MTPPIRSGIEWSTVAIAIALGLVGLGCLGYAVGLVVVNDFDLGRDLNDHPHARYHVPLYLGAGLLGVLGVSLVRAASAS